ncbi:chromosome transmission fidelity protein 8 [Xylariales sp. AK1849]|nr:chromosome transmission fidelity protein 8 [Xylariales sp. AK1849]
MASSAQLHSRKSGSSILTTNVLPPLIQTPSGLALLELQGTINLPSTDTEAEGKSPEIPIGRIVFPDLKSDALDPSSTSWMKRVHMYVGQHQRLTGEVKKLPKALAVMRKRSGAEDDAVMTDASSDDKIEHLEIVEIIKYKLVFSQRPEPVGALATG